jgi:NADPH:quinone reductase-like Zn-dependent oxidoreductase
MGVFGAGALVHAPSSLNWLQASTLTVTWLTAWNALLGLEGSKAGPGKQVLIQGTGGVSVAALQLAVALGAEVVATTSSSERAAKLKALGAKHVINYRDTPDWGKEARSLTPGGEGFDIVIDVGGNETLGQSLAAVQTGGLVNVIGAVGGQAETVPLLGALISTCIVRGILAGSRSQFNDVVRFIDEKKLKPAIDDVVFELEDAKEAYRRLSEKKHFAKVVIRIDH